MKNSPVTHGVDLADLLAEAKRLVGLLEDPQPGLATWNALLLVRLQRLRSLLEQAGIDGAVSVSVS